MRRDGKKNKRGEDDQRLEKIRDAQSHGGPLSPIALPGQRGRQHTGRLMQPEV
jgi:hypothetical protein